MKKPIVKKFTYADLISAAQSHYGSQYYFEIKKDNFGQFFLLMIKDVVDVVNNEFTQIETNEARELVDEVSLGSKIGRRLPLINPETGDILPYIALSKFRLTAAENIIIGGGDG